MTIECSCKVITDRDIRAAQSRTPDAFTTYKDAYNAAWHCRMERSGPASGREHENNYSLLEQPADGSPREVARPVCSTCVSAFLAAVKPQAKPKDNVHTLTFYRQPSRTGACGKDCNTCDTRTASCAP